MALPCPGGPVRSQVPSIEEEAGIQNIQRVGWRGGTGAGSSDRILAHYYVVHRQPRLIFAIVDSVREVLLSSFSRKKKQAGRT